MAAHSPDVLIIGGGIVGLWCAERARAAGMSCTLVDAGAIGQGASGGLLGALMPHQPTNWTDVKQFQLDALLALESEIAAL
ncbi:MAG: FAD-dependent oxidoreductase, partial [Pseudomonadota bacterium]